MIRLWNKNNKKGKEIFESSYYQISRAGNRIGIMSYDIIKAHGGEIKAETKEGEGSEFIINLPI